MTTTRTRTRPARCCGNADAIDRSDDSRRVRMNVMTETKHKTNNKTLCIINDLRTNASYDAVAITAKEIEPVPHTDSTCAAAAVAAALTLALASRVCARQQNNLYAAESTLSGQARRCPRCGCSCCSCCVWLLTATCRARGTMVLTRARAKNRDTRAPMPRAHLPHLTLPYLT